MNLLIVLQQYVLVLVIHRDDSGMREVLAVLSSLRLGSHVM